MTELTGPIHVIGAGLLGASMGLRLSPKTRICPKTRILTFSHKSPEIGVKLTNHLKLTAAFITSF